MRHSGQEKTERDVVGMRTAAVDNLAFNNRIHLKQQGKLTLVFQNSLQRHGAGIGYENLYAIS
jgi:hypothetical protein